MEYSHAERIQRLMKRNRFTSEDIKYITHADQKTVFHLLDGRDLSTSVPLKDAVASMPEDQFWSVQKGVVVAISQTVRIDENGVYTMVDGVQFKGRTRTPAEHKRRSQKLIARNGVKPHLQTLTMLEKCTVMEGAPIAFCVFELVFAENGHSIDFIFRYCNREIEVLFGIPQERMRDRSFFEVFPDGDKKWIVSYADVAINGHSRIIRSFSTEIGRHLTIRCFQPEPGYCACLLTTDV